MIETGIEEINVDDLMKKIKTEVRKRKLRTEMPEQTHPGPFPRMELGNQIKPGHSNVGLSDHSEPFQDKPDGYQMDDFLKYHHRDFVINAYRGILKRSPDSEGFDHFLRDFQSAKMTKAELLGRLRFSPEGRSKKVKVKGLAVQFGIQLLFRIPVLGYLFRLVVGILNLPTFFCNFQKLEASMAVQLNDQRNQGNDILNRMQDMTHAQREFGQELAEKAGIGDLEDLVELKVDMAHAQQQFGQELAEKAGIKDLAEKAGIKDLEDLAELKADRTEIAELLDSQVLCQLRDLKLMIIDQERRLKLLLEEARKRFPAPIEGDQVGIMLNEEDHIYDAMYVSFEDQMRGTRKDIKDRQKVYLPFVEAANAGTELYPVIDLGCGRGEWLELLGENGFFAKGVEMNHVMGQTCRDLGLDIVNEDAIRFLKRQKSNAFGAITGFHIVEHLGLNRMIALFDETFRVLKSGGVAIFETPNPENIIVGSCDFYVDPTHKNPIPPKTLQYVLEYRGFVDPQILRSTPMNFIKGKTDGAIEDLIYRFNMGQDYAVIARKV